MKLLPPLNSFTLTQPFGANFNATYVNKGLKGHNALDLRSFYGDILMTSIDSFCYNTLNKDNPDRMKYRAVCTLLQDENGNWFDLIYGHMDKIWVSAGDPLLAAEPLGTEGNTGEVYSNGVLVTGDQKNAGSVLGYHTHFQLRPVTMTDKILPNKNYLQAPNGGIYRHTNKQYFYITNFDNGYEGAIDPLPFLEKPSLFTLINLLKRALDWLRGRANHFDN